MSHPYGTPEECSQELSISESTVSSHWPPGFPRKSREAIPESLRIFLSLKSADDLIKYPIARLYEMYSKEMSSINKNPEARRTFTHSILMHFPSLTKGYKKIDGKTTRFFVKKER